MIASPLLKSIEGYVGGQWTGAVAGRSMPVVDPATGEHLADVPAMGAAEATRAVESAAAAMDTPYDLEQRRQWLEAIAEALESNKDELGRIITVEQGKPLAESVAEVDYAIGFHDVCARQIDCLGPHTLDETIRGCQWTVHHRPAGVAAFVTPWNFPIAMLAKKLSAALAAGCASVTKPASLTPLTAIAFWSLLDDVGLPAGMANLVMGPSEPIGRVMCSHPGVRIVSLTGSTETGRVLLRQAAEHIKRVTLELGGSAPFIVFDDADLDAAAEGLMASKFRCAGQTCVAASRVFVHECVADEFTERVAERVGNLRVGNGLDPGVDVGPMIGRDQFDRVAAHVRDALQRGARRIVGDEPVRPDHDWGAFFPPTVLVGATAEMLVSREETFGPVIAVSEFSEEEDVVRRSNATPFGLAAYLFTKNPARAERVVDRLEFGHVGVNTGSGPAPATPFGGMKQSGFGREGGAEGMLEFCESQVVAAS